MVMDMMNSLLKPLNASLKVIVLAISIFAGGNYVHKWLRRRKLRIALLQKQDEAKDAIDEIKTEILLKTQSAGRSKHKDILKQSVPQLLEATQNGTVRLEDVLDAYLLKAFEVDREFNCVTNVIPESLEQAKDLQLSRSESSPLYGLPVSVKECINFKGHDTTIGMSKYIGSPHMCDSVIVATLKHSGALPFVRTNLPQTTYSFESSNPIYGETTNPHNKEYCPGGSSSGEGCLIAANGSLLGFGTDTGGSIRVPCHFCGICGFKPTQNRLSDIGTSGSLPISATPGPMARDVDTLVLAMKALLCDFMFTLDKYVPPLPFNDKVYNSKHKLRIGYYYDDGYSRAAPACSRAVEVAKNGLEDVGHTLVPFTVPDIEVAMRLATEVGFADGCRFLVDALRDDTIDKRIQYQWQYLTIPKFLRKIIALGLNFVYPRLCEHLLACGGGDRSAERLGNIIGKIEQYKMTYFAEWKRLGIDAVICPTYALPPCTIGSVSNDIALMNYTILYNMLNCPAGVVPVTKVTATDVENVEAYEGHYKDPWDAHIKNVSKYGLGMSVSVQCVAGPWNEELCLRLMKEVEANAL